MKKTKPFIEPLILPLVNAINQTGLFTTFSSCEGHFAPGEQTIDDRNRADVRFERDCRYVKYMLLSTHLILPILCM
jgi:hypothetical protein